MNKQAEMLIGRLYAHGFLEPEGNTEPVTKNEKTGFSGNDRDWDNDLMLAGGNPFPSDR